MQKNLKVSIFGKSYLIATDERSEDVAEAAKIVDDLMKKKAEHMALQGESRVAVVVALELAADLAKKVQELKQWEAKVAALNHVLEVTQ